ncbi:MAG: hypothetical protein LRY50_06700 [Geovibrio sp.]|nr:hypothetical protein [Geovibrio sp.]MCD8568030.1 hypothetical protein [Geovibrio sp.]
MKKLLTISLILICFSSAYAHKLNVLAIYEGGTLNITSYFADGTYCKNCGFTITDANGSEIYNGSLSEGGEATLTDTLPESFTVTVNAGMGHSAKAEVHAETADNNEQDTAPESSSTAAFDEDALRTIIRQELGKQTVEIQAAIDSGRSNSDRIISGVGYLFGIFGLFMLFRKK